MSVRALFVAEGSGGHLIPALEAARALAKRSAEVRVWYVQRPHVAPLLGGMRTTPGYDGAITFEPIPLDAESRNWQRIRDTWRLWRWSLMRLKAWAPDVVVGFGGATTVPIVLAARHRGIACAVHEQNAVLGKANRWLSRWVDHVAVSFDETRSAVRGDRVTVTGMPVRAAIGSAGRDEAAARFRLHADRPTLLVVGGSQGAHRVNRLAIDALAHLTEAERERWQVVHLTGRADEGLVRRAYARHRMRAWVAPFFPEMELAYAIADAVLSRAGASTIAELARCGVPAILIPYPHAGGHQRANARIAASAGGAIVMEESIGTAEALAGHYRVLLGDPQGRQVMGDRMRGLDAPQANERFMQVAWDLANQGGESGGAGEP
jgi:UDP-N-acetylglucosamine--N-acetylmuramyl-(pentapeptide) pyrophosphoryl-undecaprenol N-acetylglucosamine transferase